MKALLLGLGVVALLGGCANLSGEDAQGHGAHAEAIFFVLGNTDLPSKEIVYVAEPDPPVWDRWCAFESELEPCRALESMLIDLDAPFPADVAADIEFALAPAVVEFVEDRSTVVLPSAVVPPAIANDGGLLSFGRAITVHGKIFIPVDGIGAGWLFELTPSDAGWRLDVLATWIA
jgi:hypothetical protein